MRDTPTFANSHLARPFAQVAQRCHRHVATLIAGTIACLIAATSPSSAASLAAASAGMFASAIASQNAGSAAMTDASAKQDAWSSYAEATKWWTANARGESATLTPDDLILLSEPLVGPPTAAHRAALAKVRPYLDLVRAGGRNATYGHEIDRSQGFQMVLPHLGDLRNAARALRLDAEVRLADGDVRGALASLEATAGFSRHVRDDRLLVSSLVSAAIGMLNDQTIEAAIGMGAVDADAAESLLASLAPLGGPDGARMAEAIEGEWEIMRAAVDQTIAAHEEGGANPLAELIDLDAAGVDGNMAPERLREQLAVMESMYAEAAGAIRNPDREAARAVLASIDARVEAGEAGPLGTALMPALDSAIEAAWRFEDMMANRIRLLDDIRSGRISADSLANAAHAYLAIARMTDGMDRERQAAIEAARLAPFALDAASATATRTAVESLRAPLREHLRLAARRERCDFALGRQHQSELIPAYVPGLRAAFRIMLADALLALRDDAPKVDVGSADASGERRGADHPEASPSSNETNGSGEAIPSDAEEDAADDDDGRLEHRPFSLAEVAIASLRLTRHCALDPRVGHLLVLGSILDEVAAASAEAVAQRGRERIMTASEMADLQRAIALAAGPDPLASKASIDRERDRLRQLMVRARQPEPDIEVVMSRGMRTMAFALLLQQLGMASTQTDAHGMASVDLHLLPTWWERAPGAMPLRSAMDLISVESSTLATTRLAAWRDLLLEPESPESPRDWFRFLNATPWPETIDPDAARDRGVRAIARLEELAKGPQATGSPSDEKPVR